MIEAIPEDSQLWTAMAKRFPVVPPEPLWASILFWLFCSLPLVAKEFLNHAPSAAALRTLGWLIGALAIAHLAQWLRKKSATPPSLAEQVQQKQVAQAERLDLARRTVDLCFPYGETLLSWDARGITEQTAQTDPSGKTTQTQRSWAWSELVEVHDLGESYALHFDSQERPLLLLPESRDAFLSACRKARPHTFRDAAR